MSHTDLAIRAQIQALDLQLFRLSVTADASAKLPIKIPLKPMKTMVQATDKVRYCRFSHSKGYRIGLIPLQPHTFCVLQTPIAPDLPSILAKLGIAIVYCNVFSATHQQCWLSADAAAMFQHAELAAALQSAAIAWELLACEQGQGLLAGFRY